MSNVSFLECYVAYLDILGFSDIVKRVVSDDSADDLKRLYKCHQKSQSLFADDSSIQLLQFSDSIVISKPYDASHFSKFIEVICEYQRLLLGERFLCRGGISRGRHFSNGSFMMSAGLVSAYELEKGRARYPRVVISGELLSLVGLSVAKRAKLIQEDDGVVFADYLKCRVSKRLSKATETCIAACRTDSRPDVREKGVWLAAYADRSLKSSFSMDRFFEPDFDVVANLSG